MVVPAIPAERIHCGSAVLLRMREEDAADVAAAIKESLDHLQPWMPWATAESTKVNTQRTFSRDAEDRWNRGSDFIYVLRQADDGAVLGTFGLHRRIGPDAMEIGYWLHVAHTGRGHATTAAGALTEAAFQLADVERVEIHTDEANLASAAVPQRLAYRLDRVEPTTPATSAETGRLQIWVRR